MTFEIQKMEGLGRLGKLSMVNSFETPSFLNICFIETLHLSTELEENILPQQSNELQHSLRQANLLDCNKD
ncbi:MAG: hypothetical protein KAT16_09285, partial [Candidatus Heimdallarchaeota archaeon]|nr:hypothetical protein [Candidatus Heimdallarchaeota archaeon]